MTKNKYNPPENRSNKQVGDKICVLIYASNFECTYKVSQKKCPLVKRDSGRLYNRGTFFLEHPVNVVPELLV